MGHFSHGWVPGHGRSLSTLSLPEPPTVIPRESSRSTRHARFWSHWPSARSFVLYRPTTNIVILWDVTHSWGFSEWEFPELLEIYMGHNIQNDCFPLFQILVITHHVLDKHRPTGWTWDLLFERRNRSIPLSSTTNYSLLFTVIK